MFQGRCYPDNNRALGLHVGSNREPLDLDKAKGIFEKDEYVVIIPVHMLST